MAVLVIADVPEQTPEGFDQVLTALRPALQQAKGFIAVGAGATANGSLTFEVWESAEDATRFFKEYVHPNLPAGIRPKRTLLHLHRFVQRETECGGRRPSMAGESGESGHLI